MTLLYTSCAVRLQPLVWLWVRSDRLFGFLGSNCLDDLRPQHARGAHLGDLHEDVLADRPEERQPRGEVVDFQPGRDAGAQVFQAVGHRVAELEVGGGAGFLHVVARDADAVELRHVLAGVGEDVAR